MKETWGVSDGQNLLTGSLCLKLTTIPLLQGVGRDLEAQWQELMALRQVLHSLPAGGGGGPGRLRVSVSPGHLERRISASQDAHAGLEARCQALRALLETRLRLWRTFEERLEAVRATVQEADYMVDLLSVGTSLDLDRLVAATERLEVSSVRQRQRGVRCSLPGLSRSEWGE